MSNLPSRWQDKEYRESYLEASIEQGIAWQIRINRQKRGLSQADLAAIMGEHPSFIQKLEDPERGEYDINTLVKVAKKFDCALSVKLIPYSKLAEDSQNLSEDAQYAPPFDSLSS